MVISECCSVNNVKGETLTQFVVPPSRHFGGTRTVVKEIRMATVKVEFGTEHFMETAWKHYELR